MRLIDADELLRKLEEYFNEKEQDAKFTGNRGSEVSWNDAIYYIRTAPSAQPEQDAEFWRKRAEEYRDQCIALTVDMATGIKLDSMCFNEDGLVFKWGQPEQRWIPVSERLPEIGKEVLLSEPNAMFVAVYFGSGNPKGLWLAKGLWLPKGLWLVDGRYHFLADVNECAWMPLPKSYQGEGE